MFQLLSLSGRWISFSRTAHSRKSHCHCFFVCLFIFDCAGSSLLHRLSLVTVKGGSAEVRVQASHRIGLSCCGAQALGVPDSVVWHTGLVAPWHVESSQTKD